jgi:hypothetical protein
LTTCPHFKILIGDIDYWVYIANKEGQYFLRLEPAFSKFSKIDRFKLHEAFKPYEKEKLSLSTPNIKYLLSDIELFIECILNVELQAAIKSLI